MRDIQQQVSLYSCIFNHIFNYTRFPHKTDIYLTIKVIPNEAVGGLQALHTITVELVTIILIL
jgi:hypothetical protein